MGRGGGHGALLRDHGDFRDALSKSPNTLV